MGKKEATMGTVKKILILHGWTYSTEKWGPFLNDLKKDGFNAELLKIPGLTEKLDDVWDIDNYVEWLNGKIHEDKIILVGHSNGGRIILAFAAKYPDKIKKIILIDSAGIYHNEMPIRLKRIIFKTLARIGRKITKSETLRKALYKLSRESDYENAPPVVKKTMNNMINFDITPFLRKIKIPTLIIWGAKDKTTPLSDGKIMHQLISNSKLAIINDAKHSPQFTHPEKVTELIYEYL